MGDTATDVKSSGTTGVIPDQEVCKIDSDCSGVVYTQGGSFIKSICCPAEL